MREIWREPSGYEGVVLVSNKGRVFKLPQKGGKGTGRYSRDGHLLKQTKINTMDGTAIPFRYGGKFTITGNRWDNPELLEGVSVNA